MPRPTNMHGRVRVILCRSRQQQVIIASIRQTVWGFISGKSKRAAASGDVPDNNREQRHVEQPQRALATQSRMSAHTEGNEKSWQLMLDNEATDRRHAPTADRRALERARRALRMSCVPEGPKVQ